LFASGKGGCQSKGVKRGHKSKPRENRVLVRRIKILRKRDYDILESDRGLSREFEGRQEEMETADLEATSEAMEAVVGRQELLSEGA
jgi:hypothetical protein